MLPTDQDKSTARLHATVWEHAWDSLRQQYERASPVADATHTAHLKALSFLAMTIGGAYRRIANGSEIDE
jgi:hypothetical protein